MRMPLMTVVPLHKVWVTGLEGTTYVDKVDGMKHKPQGTDWVTITG